MDQQSPSTAFPEEAIAWLLGTSARTVAVLGDAGIAEACATAGHDVTNVEGVHRLDELPFTDRSVDALVSVRSVPRDLDDVARVLRPGGQLALVHNQRDRRIPWARKLDDALQVAAPTEDPAARMVASTLFGFVSEGSFRHWQIVNNQTLPEVLADELAHLDDSVRQQRLAAALALYDDYGRGADGMQLPWVSLCFKATLVEHAWAPPHAYDERPSGADQAAGASEEDGPTPQDGSDSDLLLIDFR